MTRDWYHPPRYNRSQRHTDATDRETVMRVPMEDILDGMELDDNIGFCTTCGAENGGVEPDAKWVKCQGCLNRTVFGVEVLLVTEGREPTR